MKIIQETPEAVIYLAHFEGKPIRFYKNKFTNEIHISADDALAALGAGSVDEYFSTDDGLDLINYLKHQNPGVDIFGEKGMFKKINLTN